MFYFTYDSPGVAKGGTGVLKVDGEDVATLKMPHTIPFLLPVGETFDVGIDTRTPVNDKHYPGAVRLQRQAQPANLPPRTGAVFRIGTEEDSRSGRHSEPLRHKSGNLCNF